MTPIGASANPHLKSLERKIIVGRLFSRAGDHAWDFAVPMAILKIFPNQLFLPILYYFAARVGTVLLMPIIGAGLDRSSRRRGLVVWALAQVVGVAMGAGLLVKLSVLAGSVPGSIYTLSNTLLIAWLIGAGLLAALGAGILDILVLNFVIPEMILPENLTKLNSRISQVDLAMEVSAPFAAGFLLMWTHSGFALAGFAVIAVVNVLSFLPEVFILLRFLPAEESREDKGQRRQESEQLTGAISNPSNAAPNFISAIIHGWKDFFREPVSASVLAYSFLWLSILSPHGVLLTTYLKGVWNLPESTLGIFRGLGALFGFAGTVAFPWVVQKLGLFRASSRFIGWQALMVFVALLAFWALTSSDGIDRVGGQSLGVMGVAFLAAILLSRAGLYGFCLGELEIRQTMVPAERRGRINGFASSWLNLMTLVVYGLGSVLATPSGFSILIITSTLAVVAGAVMFSIWCAKISRSQ